MSEKSCAISPVPFVPVEIWDGLHVAVAVEVLIELYGLQAATLAAWCAIEARSDFDNDRYRFWFSVFCHLRKASPVYPLIIPPAFENNRLMPDERQAIPASRHNDITALLGSKNLGDSIIRIVRSIMKN